MNEGEKVLKIDNRLRIGDGCSLAFQKKRAIRSWSRAFHQFFHSFLSLVFAKK